MRLSGFPILKSLAVGVGLLLGAAAPAQAIIYNVAIDFGGGASATGFFETNGTLGVLANSDIYYWRMTLTSDNLADGSPLTIDNISSGLTDIGGSGLYATATEVLFDFTPGPTQYLILQEAAGSGNFLLLINSTDFGVGTGISIGFGSGSPAAETLSIETAGYVFGTTESPPVAMPEPGAHAVLGLGFAALGLARRRRSGAHAD